MAKEVSLEESRRSFETAKEVLPDGGSRSTISLSPHSIYIKSAKGKYLNDIDGNRYFDLNNNYTALIHGHAHPEVTKAAISQIKKGTGFSFGSETEYSYAEMLCSRNQNFEKIRFMNSGTEAVMNAIKAARAYTGKSKIVKCENSYHGSYDYAEVSLGVDKTSPEELKPKSMAYSSGTPQGVLDDVVIIPFNNASVAKKIIEESAHELAAILIDPFGQTYGRSIPSDEFLEMLEDVCEKYHILLIADEVVSFRAGYSGCQAERQINPHLTALGKIIGGGFPIGAVAGHNDVMDVFESHGERAKLPHGGTFNANPVSMAAGKKTMEMLTEDVFIELNKLGALFRSGIKEVFELSDVDGRVEGQFSIFGMTINEAILSDCSERGKVYKSNGLHYYMLSKGYWLTPGLTGVCSTVMDRSDVNTFCETLLKGIQTLRS